MRPPTYRPSWPTPLASTLLSLIMLLASILLFTPRSTSTPLAARVDNENILLRELTPLLSPSAAILVPSSPEFTALLNQRWSTSPLNLPRPSAIVIPATESDISQTIRFANARALPFLATSGGHGTSRHLAAFVGGVLIHLRNLTQFALSPGDGATTVALGGGSISQHVVRRLWERGKQTTTGACGCVSIAGPLLGGGHGMLQGRYGLLADQLVSARVVLADGEVVEASERERPDLFWALRGAGHNFGVVSEVQYRVYDVPEGRRTWAYGHFWFGGNRLEEYYELAKRMMLGQPAHVVAWSVWYLDVTMDAEKPVIRASVYYNGPEEEFDKYTEPIRALGPLSSASGVTEYPGVMEAMGTAIGQRDCSHQGTAILRAADVDEYNIGDLRKWYDLFSDMVTSNDALASAACMLERYSVQAVQAVPDESTAFPHRNQNLLLAPFLSYKITGNVTLDAEAERWAKAFEAAAFGKQTRRTYVNYAHGDESLQALYGYEPWRLKKLRELKQKYDPENRFRFFAPIVPE